MSDSRLIGGPMPRDVLPATDQERYERAEKYTRDLRKLVIDEGHKAIKLGQILHDIYRQELWRSMADTWKEYINDVGLSAPMEFQARKNYEVYVLEFGLDPTDRRLSEAPPSKLFVGTRGKFKQWVADNIDAFLDYARKPLGEGGLTRSDLYKYLEEQVGITTESESSLVRKALRAFRRGATLYRQLADDDWAVFVEAFRNDEDLYDTVSALLDSARKWDSEESVVSLDE